MTPLIGIVTVLYNSETVLEDFFKSLSLQSYTNFILYVIDNKSPDSSLDISKKLARMYPFKTVIIENNKNDGVARGNNLGIKKSLEDSCDLVLISNNDVILENNTIETLLEGFNHHHASMVVPKIYYSGTDRIWAAGGFFQKWSGLVLHIGDRQKDIGQFEQDKRIEYAATCFMLVDKSVFKRIGFMDERYFVYWDDTDFVYRALKHGEILWYLHKPIVYHKESTSTGYMSDFSIRYLTRNSVYFALKNYQLAYAIYVIVLNILFHCLVLLFKWPFRQWKLRFRSYWEGWNLYLSSLHGEKK